MPTLKLLPTRSHSLLIELRFFEEPFVFVVDTGAETTSISQTLCNKILQNCPQEESFYKRIKNGEHHGVGGRQFSQKVPLKINILGQILQGISINHIFDEWKKNHRFYYYPGDPMYDGLLGIDVMGKFEQVNIDFVRKEISFL